MSYLLYDTKISGFWRKTFTKKDIELHALLLAAIDEPNHIPMKNFQDAVKYLESREYEVIQANNSALAIFNRIANRKEFDTKTYLSKDASKELKDSYSLSLILNPVYSI